jgi:hypothetical protein
MMKTLWHRFKCWLKGRNPRLVDNKYQDVTLDLVRGRLYLGEVHDIMRDERGSRVWLNGKRIQDYEGLN